MRSIAVALAIPTLCAGIFAARVGEALAEDARLAQRDPPASLASPGEAVTRAGDATPLVRVPPEYPAEAERRGLEGWVTVEFTVDRDGNVEDPRVVASAHRVFHAAAREAILGWKYQPRRIDGKPVEQPATRVTLNFSFGEECEYKTLYVNRENLLYEGKGLQKLEKRRLAYLRAASEAATKLGLRVVDDPSDAFFQIKTGAHFVDAPAVELFLALNGMLKLHHHIFVSLTDDAEFPYRGRLGGSHAWLMDDPKLHGDDKFSLMAETAMRTLWERDRPQIEALCGVREKLVAEGWQDIEELRSQLVVEMMRARARRARETQEKQLEIEVEK